VTITTDAQLRRFLRNVVISDGCWEWTGARTRGGYGYFWLGVAAYPAHRVAYATVVGAIPAGLDLDHLCRVRHCVNPRHLEPVTRSENIRRAKAAA
jgi:hypothetical protein